MKRRTFLSQTTKPMIGLSAAMLAGNPRQVLGANDKIRIGLVGCGGRGLMLFRAYSRDERFQFAYMCDPDPRRGAREFEWAKAEHNPHIKRYTDFRRMLDDKNVDMVMIATPDHWHALATILACQAEKDVYVEKPMSHNLVEGRKMIEAARKYNRVVQVGMQSRSAPYLYEAAEYIRSGKLGDIQLCKIFNMKSDRPFHADETLQPPKELNLDVWLGAAREKYAYVYASKGWLFYWDFCNGDMMNDGVHQIDIARWLLNQRFPKSAYCTGGNFAFDDDREVPDTQCAVLEFDNQIVTIENTQNMQYMQKTTLDMRNRSEFPLWQHNATRIEIYGSKGLMMVGRHGSGWQVFSKDGQVVAEAHGQFPDEPHKDNLYECLHSRKRANADVEEGHISCAWVHLANISLKLGGRKLVFDAASEKCDVPEANALLQRQYRKPYQLPTI
ncbi:MAG: Gfo/Idh/MocA family oxidoreductase [Candidatus Hinthialibacter antarcticus]|nr:Gfo/Idh/MocA family oxidoreductase [Candidatus Hinthialibacter antarcticus]